MSKKIIYILSLITLVLVSCANNTTPNYTITFHNGASPAETKTQFCTPKVKQYLPENTFVKAEHSFVGWETVADSKPGEVDYVDGALYVREDESIIDEVLTAQWVSGYIIVFNANGGTGTMANQNFPVAGDTIDANTFTREDYDFAGWTETATGTSLIADGATYQPDNQGTLYAQWKKK